MHNQFIQLASRERHAQLTRCFSAVAELHVRQAKYTDKIAHTVYR